MSVFNVWIDDRFIAREIKLSGKLVTKGPLRIGAGREAVSLESSVDLPVLRRAGSHTYQVRLLRVFLGVLVRGLQG